MKKAPLLYHQFVLLEEAFRNHHIPLQKMAWYFDSFVLSEKYTNADELKHQIILGGSAYYHGLMIEACKKSDLGNMVNTLTAHQVPLLYRYVRIWSEDHNIELRGKSWFTKTEDCEMEAKKVWPKFYAFDGPDCPQMIFSMETTCLCFNHNIDGFHLIAPECLCYQPRGPFSNKQEINIDGLTIVRSISTGWTYNYMVVIGNCFITWYQRPSLVPCNKKNIII